MQMAAMTESNAWDRRTSVIRVEALDDLIRILGREGYDVIGPKADDGAICFGPHGSAAHNPVGLAEEQDKP